MFADWLKERFGRENCNWEQNVMFLQNMRSDILKVPLLFLKPSLDKKNSRNERNVRADIQTTVTTFIFIR